VWSTAPGLLLFCLQFGGRRLTTPLEALMADVSRPLCRVHPAVSPPPLIRAGRVPMQQRWEPSPALPHSHEAALTLQSSASSPNEQSVAALADWGS
jgi:hypothetical protein